MAKDCQFLNDPELEEKYCNEISKTDQRSGIKSLLTPTLDLSLKT